MPDDVVRDDIVRLLNEQPALAGDADEDFITDIESVVESVAVVRAEAPTVPDFVPSHVVHAWGSDEAQVTLAAPHVQDAGTRYDFLIVLPPVDGPERVPALLRESIQEQFGVDVIRQDGDPPTLVVDSR